MRALISVLLVVSASACTSEEACNLLPLESSLDNKGQHEITARSDPVFRSMVNTGGRPIRWEKGLALEAMCCATKDWGQPRSWCTPEQLECTDPKLQGVKIWVLAAPYSSEDQPNWGNYCIAAVHENTIIALWHRTWT